MGEEFDAFLNDISRCFVERDVELWLSRLRLPFSIVTRTGPTVMSDRDAIERNFQHYLTAMQIMNVDLIDRRAISIEDCKDGTWLGTFETRLVSDGRLTTAPYTATALLQRAAGRLLMSSMLNGRGHAEWTSIEGA